MTPDQKQEIEQIEKDFQQEQQELLDLRQQILDETDENKKAEENEKADNMQRELDSIKELMNKINDLQKEELDSLKKKLEDIKNIREGTRSQIADLQSTIEQQSVHETPTTCEMLRGSKTYLGLVDVIAKNPENFKDLPGDGAEAKLEYIFNEVRTNVVKFLKNKFGESVENNEVINNTMAPAIEWNLMQLLREQGNETNGVVLDGLNNISVEKLGKLVKGVTSFAKGNETGGAFGKFDARVNALDFLAVHNKVLKDPKKSAVLTNPIKFQEYLENQKFNNPNFSPYSSLSTDEYIQLFEIKDESLNYGLSNEEKETLLNGIQGIGNIEIAPNARTTSLIVKLLGKSEQFLDSSQGLQNAANHLLDGVNGFNSITKVFGVDILGEISKAPAERGFLFKVLDFVCKLIGITGGLEGIVKKWRMDRLDLTSDKNVNISSIFEEYQESMGKENHTVSIKDKTSCMNVLNDFVLHDMKEASVSRGDKLRDCISEKMDLKLISPNVVQHCLGASYLKKETFTENGKKKERILVDESKFDDSVKMELAHKHINNMLQHFTQYDDLKDFYSNINTVDDLALCMTVSFYTDKEDIIEGVKAKVFLPENYMDNYTVSQSGGSSEVASTGAETSSELVRTSTELYPSQITQQQKDNIKKTLQSHNSPITLDNIVTVANDKGIPATYLAAVIENDSSSGTTGKGASTHNPGNVGNTDSGNTRSFNTREEGLSACADVIKERLDAYKQVYTVSTGYEPPIGLLLANQGPDGKGFLASYNYKQPNPYRTEGGEEKAPIGAYMTSVKGPGNVESIVSNYA